MGKLKEFGICFENRTAEETIACSRLAETLGYGTAWLAEDYFFRGIFTVAAAIACHTTSLKIGIGVINPYTRHPGLIAMEYGALEELSGGRSILGLGAGVRYWMETQLKIPYTKPLVAMRESVDIVRRLFRGEEVNYQGQVFKTSTVRLHFTPPRSQVPIHIGVTSPKNLQLAGEIGDGVILGFISSAAYARHAMEQVRIGAARAGRNLEGFDVTIYLTISIGEDDRAAREVVKPFLATCLALMGDYADAPLFTESGIDPDEVRHFGAVYAKEGTPPTRLVTDRIIDTLAIAGSPARCRDALRRFVDAGITSAVAFEIPGVSFERTIRETHAHLMGAFL